MATRRPPAEPPTEPPAEPQPLWQPPPALVALVAWLRRLRRGGVELLRANPRRIGAAAYAAHRGLKPRASSLRVFTGDPHAKALQCIQPGLLLTRLSPALDRSASLVCGLLLRKMQRQRLAV